MTDNNEYDALGELFRRRLENHRIPIDGNGWEKIERSLGKRKRRTTTLLWYGIAAAAAIATLLIVVRPATDKLPATTVSQQIFTEEHVTPNYEALQNVVEPEMTHIAITNPYKEKTVTEKKSDNIEYIYILEPDETETSTVTGSVTQLPGYSVTDSVTLSPGYSVTKLDISLVEDKPEEDDADAKNTGKWLFAAAIGMGSFSKSLNDELAVYDNAPSSSLLPDAAFSGGNDYAAGQSRNIQPFSKMSKNDFTSVNHRQPFSLGMTVRKKFGKNGGVESGLVYTYLASNFEWSNEIKYNVHQSLHYMGIPLNLTVYLGKDKSNWRFYFSGGFMTEKCLRAVYSQERYMKNETRNTTVESHSINDLQWSVNSALGVNYSLKNGFGVYFEPRFGYSFNADPPQPMSMRTEWPLFIGFGVGVNIFIYN